MTCDVARNRLLALPDPARPTDDLLPHLAGCGACRAAQAAAVQLDGLLKRLPVPPPARRAQFLADLEADGPVIRTRPVVPSTLAGSGSFRPVTRWLKRLDWRYAGGGVAAAFAVGLGLFFFAPTDPPQAQADPPERPRSERLARLVKHTTTLAGTAHAPHQRLGVYADFSEDLKAEACEVYKVAGRDEMNSLASQYEAMVKNGVVKQAKLLDDKPLPPDVRSESLHHALKKLSATEADIATLAADAPPNARPALGRIAESAQQARRELNTIALGNPKKGSQP